MGQVARIIDAGDLFRNGIPNCNPAAEIGLQVGHDNVHGGDKAIAVGVISRRDRGEPGAVLIPQIQGVEWRIPHEGRVIIVGIR